ncbi:hypothetical protein K450DRAFT_221990 [Umbelopsis ramanniana AG]|uniref:Alpha/beta hydrolase n=1 Tax=Umbelopsis ramanniana AG TaxID=1314678 RepID=A0AAD5EHI3_UMBRA|nr:uncharacterized protein K450DRAFT_221990 [Umbelopsis ramanniana AG]KAI8583614.1 hypothetical protein K450DRAFT_221990 [Umbelopsis ramanniana AG]
MDNIQLKTDTRFTYSYRLYCSPGKESDPLQLLVAVHGNERDAKGLLEGYEQNANHLAPGNYAMLSPLFPAGILGDGWEQGYKFLHEKDIRYDTLLFDMIHQLCHHDLHLQQDIPTFLLHGYSGGGQFVHRLFYLHPERITALFVGAPGAITVISDEHHWWYGTRGMKKAFDLHGGLDLNAMKKVPVMMLVGDKDTNDMVYSKKATEKFLATSSQEALDAIMGRNRLERMHILYNNWKQAGLNVQLQVIPGLGHNGARVVPNAAAFFASLA